MTVASSPAWAGWVEATTSPIEIGGEYEPPSLAFIGGVPHVLYQHGNPFDTRQVYVKKLVAGAWVALGTTVNTLPTTSAGAAIVEYGGQPCVAYVETSNNGTAYARVVCWTGSIWQRLGFDLVTGTSRLGGAQMVASGSELAVLLREDWQDVDRTYISVYRWSGGAWQPCGTPGDGQAHFSPLLQLVGGTPRVAAPNENYPGIARIRRWNGGTTWVDVDTFFVDRTVGYANLAGTQYFAHLSNEESEARVLRWSGSTWEQQGGIADSRLSSLNMGTDGTRPYLVFAPAASTVPTVIAKRLVNGAWTQLQGSLRPASIGRSALAFDGATPYVAWLGATHDPLRGGGLHLSYWQAGLSASVLVPDADRAGIVEWAAPTAPSCTLSTVDLWAQVDEYRDSVHLDCAAQNSDGDYVESAVGPTPANRFAFELSAPPGDMTTATQGRIILHGWKTGGKTATLTVWLRKADGTLVTSSVFTPTATPAPLVATFGPLSLSRAEADGLYIEGTAAVSGGGSATAVGFSMLNVELTYDEAPSATPPAVTLVSPSGSVATQTPTLTAIYNDSDPGDLAEVTFWVCLNTPCDYSPTSAVVSGVAAGGTATWTPIAPFTVGRTYYWRAQAKDAAGNLSDLPDNWLAFTVTAGTLPSIADNQPGDDTWRATNNGTYDVDFNAPQGLAAFDVRVYTGPNESGTLLQDWTQVSTLSGTSHTTNWALPSSTWAAMVEGTNYLSVRLRDSTAQTAVAPAAFYVRKDTLAPSLTISSPPADSYVNATNQSAFSLAGTCTENGATIFVTGAATGSAPCIGNSWAVTLNLSGAPQGALLLDADAQDAAGNPAATVSRSFIKDSVPPSVTFSAPAAGTFVTAGNQASLAVTGTCSEEGRSVALSGAATASPLCSGGTFSATLNFTSAPQGALTLTATLADVAGNAATANLPLTKDTVLPTVTLTSAPYVNLANRAAFQVSGNCSENGRNVVLSGAVSRSVACATGSWSTTLDLTAAADGPVSLYADLQDAAGNSASQASLTLTKDTVAPTVAFTTPAPGSFVTPSNQSALVVVGDCSDQGASVAISGSAAGTTSCNLGGFSLALDLSSAPEGTVSLTAQHADPAGNSATGSLTLTKDVSPPVVATVRDGPGIDLATQTSLDTLEANWDAFADPHSGIALYEWAIGTAQGATDVRGFASVGTQTSASASGLTLASGQSYFVTVRASNGAGLSSAAFSDGVRVIDQRPLITREANDRAAVGIPYRYSATGRVRATSSSPVTFDTCGGPSDVLVDPVSGALQWTPSAAGLTSLCVRATNAFGVDSYAFDVAVVQTPPPPPVARITTGPLGVAPTSVTFDGSASTADTSALPLVHLWSTEDGAASGAGAQWVHHYDSPAIYTTTLAVFDAYGQSASTSVTLDLRPPPAGRYSLGCGCDETGSAPVSESLLAFFLASLSVARRQRRAKECPVRPPG